MIKLTLVKFIRQFDIKRYWLEFNKFFLPAIGITLGSILLAYFILYLYSHFISNNYFMAQGSFWNEIYKMVIEEQKGAANMFSVVFSFNLMLLAIIKINRSGQFHDKGKIYESYAFGFLIIFIGLLFLGRGLQGLFKGDFFMSERSSILIIIWIDTILKTIFPAIAFYLGLHFLRRGMGISRGNFSWSDFFNILITYLVLISLIKIIATIFTEIILSPLIIVFGFADTLLSMVLTISLMVALISFLMIIASDMLVILVNKKLVTPIKSHTNPDLLDR